MNKTIICNHIAAPPRFRLLPGLLVVLLILLPFVIPAASAWAMNLSMARALFEVQHEFRQPSDLAVADDGRIYVVDGVNNCIKVFDAAGLFQFAFGSKGVGAGEFHYPLGIDLDGKGRVYVADSGNHRVQIFSPQGKFLAEIRVPSATGKAADPTDVAATRDGTACYIVDNDNHCLHVYDLTAGKFVASYGAPGIDKWEFRYPFLLSLYQDKYLYIVDVVNTRVQVLSTDGKFVNFIGGWGVEKGEFFRPKGVAVDRLGRCYVSDSYMGVVQVFNHTGDFVSAIGDPATGKLRRFKSPCGLYVANDKLYVVEMFAEKVSVFAIEDLAGQP